MNNSSKQQKELARLQRESDWRKVLGTTEGQRVMSYLLQSSGHHLPSYGGMDTQATAYREGQRSMGQFIIRQVQTAAPEHLATIIMGGLHEFGTGNRSNSHGNDHHDNGDW